MGLRWQKCSEDTHHILAQSGSPSTLFGLPLTLPRCASVVSIMDSTNSVFDAAYSSPDPVVSTLALHELKVMEHCQVQYQLKHGLKYLVQGSGHTCAVCQMPTVLTCAACRDYLMKRYYCSSDCQHVDWEYHKPLCGKTLASKISLARLATSTNTDPAHPNVQVTD